MQLEGVITNVTNFGAFVDIGVHQDGLVHISKLSNRLGQDPREVVKAGGVVQVKMLEVDADRQRIVLTMRLDEKAERKAKARPGKQAGRRGTSRKEKRPATTSMAAAFAEVKG